MIKISKMADYAIVIIEAMSRNQCKLASASVLSCLTKLPEPTVAKILKILSRNDIVTSVRGIRGGYKLSSPLQTLTLERLIQAVDGPVCITACADNNHDDACNIYSSCSMRQRWGGVNEALKKVLSQTTLADMFEDNNYISKPLEENKLYGGN